MKNLLSIIVFISFAIVGKSQLSIDSLSTYQNIAPQDTVPYNTPLNFNVKVLYNSSIPFTGTLYLVSGVDSSAGLKSIDTVGFLNVVNLVNDSAIIPFNDVANNQNGYRKGGDIIVIWPVANGINTIDTFYADIWVEPALSSVKENELYNKFFIYPNPATEVISIDNNSYRKIEKVRVRNINGSLIFEQDYQQKIDVSLLNKGVYILEIDIGNHQKLIYRIIKEN